MTVAWTPGQSRHTCRCCSAERCAHTAKPQCVNLKTTAPSPSALKARSPTAAEQKPAAESPQSSN
eukprot:16026-Heterococcus_DN1.PRE.1